MTRQLHGSRPFALAVVLALVVTAASCGARQEVRGQSASDLDRKLSTFAFIEEGDLLMLVVGTQAARYRDKDAYIPLEICIANNGLRQLILTRESFTLIDEEGNRYPLATPRELFENYEFLDLDREMLRQLEGILFNKLAAYTRYPSKFSPTQEFRTGGGNIVRDLVSLPRYGYLFDYLYFPKPSTGIKGHRFDLFVESPSLENPVFVKFEVK